MRKDKTLCCWTVCYIVEFSCSIHVHGAYKTFGEGGILLLGQRISEHSDYDRREAAVALVHEEACVKAGTRPLDNVEGV